MPAPRLVKDPELAAYHDILRRSEGQLFHGSSVIQPCAWSIDGAYCFYLSTVRLSTNEVVPANIKAHISEILL